MEMGNASLFRRNEEEVGDEEYMEYVHGSPKAYPSALLFTPQRSGREHGIMKLLPLGVCHYRFFVDGQRRCSPDLPQECDHMENIFNILNLQDHKQEIHDNILEYETPRLSSYDDPSLNIEDFSEKVPELPPVLQRTPLDQPPSSSDNLMSLEKPVPAMLNHFYMHKPSSGESMVALSSTERFRKKYVAAVLYKYLKKLKV